jgi:hypothetical protein
MQNNRELNSSVTRRVAAWAVFACVALVLMNRGAAAEADLELIEFSEFAPRVIPPGGHPADELAFAR